MVDIARYDDTSNACMLLAQMCRQARTADILCAELAAAAQPGFDGRMLLLSPCDSRAGLPPAGAVNRIVRRWISRQAPNVFHRRTNG